MEAKELRIGNWVYDADRAQLDESNGYVRIVSLAQKVGHHEHGQFGGICHSGNYYENLAGIPLTPEILEKAGFVKMPHYTVTGTMNIKLSRDRVLSVACVGTPNEMVFISEENPPLVNALIVARNFDYDGKTYLHQIQNIYYALCGKELTIEL